MIFNHMFISAGNVVQISPKAVTLFVFWVSTLVGLLLNACIALNMFLNHVLDIVAVNNGLSLDWDQSLLVVYVYIFTIPQ